MLKVKEIKLQPINGNAENIDSKVLVNYIDKNFQFLNQSLLVEVGSEVIKECSYLLQQNGKQLESCQCFFTEAGLLKQSFLLHIVASKNLSDLELIYFNIFETLYKHKVKNVALNLFELSEYKIDRHNSFKAFFLALKKFSGLYSNYKLTIHVGCNDEKEVEIFKLYYDKMFNTLIEKVKKLLLI